MPAFPFLKDNVEALARHGHAAYHWLSNSPIDPQRIQQKLFINRFGLLDWRTPEGQGLFEALPPQTLYRDWTAKDRPHTSATLVIGCNVGYGINHLLLNTPDSHKVVVLEPNPEIVLACLGQTDYRPFFEIKKLHFCLPDEDYLFEVVRNLDLQYIYGQIHLLADVPSRQLGPEYAQWMIKARHKLENFGVELVTLRQKQDVMVGNEIRNFRRALGDGSLMPLKDSAAGLAAVILGAGPSLAEFAPALAADPGYALYTTALQTMPALQNFGLAPHLCLALDYDDSMLKVYERLDPAFARDVPLIYSTKTNPELVRRYPGPTLPLWTQGGLATFAMQGEFVLDAGGNVSLTLARLLRWCGVGHLVLVGQDFAWKGDSTHAAGHHAAGAPADFMPGRDQKLTNLRGEEIVTSLQYLTSKREFEGDLKKSPLPVFNLYGGGADIEGATPIDLDYARKNGVLASGPGSLQRFLSALDRARQTRRGFTFEPKSHRWTTSLRGAEKRLEKLFKRTAENQAEIHTLMEQVMGFLRHDPLYLPYLFNETIDLAGLTRAKLSYEPRDFFEFKKIGKNVLKKVKEIDRHLGRPQAAA
jgi:hypothetical protein